MTTPDTRERLINAAERLFAEHGFAATTLRAVMTEACVDNMAAVHYYFGSKRLVFDAVIERRIKMLEDDRLDRLNALEQNGERTLEAITNALIGPMLEAAGAGEEYWIKLLARRCIEHGPHWDNSGPAAHAMFDRFVQAYADIAPRASREEIAHAIYLVTGAILTTLLDTQSLKGVGHGLSRLEENRALLRERAARFFIAGLRSTLQVEPQPATLHEGT